MPVIARQLFFGETTGYGVVPERSTKTKIYIPVSEKTKSEIDNMWSGLPTSSDAATIVSTFLANGIGGGGFPYFDPGRAYGGNSYSTFPRYQTLAPVEPRSIAISGSITKNYLAYCDSTGSGLYAAYGVSLRLMINNTNAGQVSVTGDYSTLGFGGYSHATAIYANILFVSSDDYVGLTSIGSNKNNSVFRWFNSADSQRLLTWLNGLPVVQPSVGNILIARFEISPHDAGATGTDSFWTDPLDWNIDPTTVLNLTVNGALSGRHNDPLNENADYSYIPDDQAKASGYGCGGNGGHGGGGGAGSSTIVVNRFATDRANIKNIVTKPKRHGYGSGGGKGGEGGDGCILIYY